MGFKDSSWHGRWRARRAVTPAALAATCVLALAAPATAATRCPPPAKITIFSAPGISLSAEAYTDDSITAGQDGALWFTNPGNDTIGRITTAGQVTDYRDPGINDPWAIINGPDGAVWFTNFGGPTIGRITAAGKVTTYSGAVNGPVSIASGRDGALWYSNWPLVPVTGCSWSIGRMAVNGTSVCYKAPGVGYPQDIIAGPDGALWFTIGGDGGGDGFAIGRITTSGTIHVYPVPYWPNSIAAGPDGALWFTEPHHNTIARMTTNGVVTNRFRDCRDISIPTDITAGPDGALWFINMGNNTVGRITTAGGATAYHGAFGLRNGQPGITSGPDGSIWFTNPTTNTIGRITTAATSHLPTAAGR